METILFIIIYFSIKYLKPYISNFINEKIKYYSINNILIKNAIIVSDQQVKEIYNKNIFPKNYATQISSPNIQITLRNHLILINFILTKQYLSKQHNLSDLYCFNEDVEKYFKNNFTTDNQYNFYKNYKFEEIEITKILFLPLRVTEYEIILTHILYGIDFLNYSSIIYNSSICRTLTSLIVNTF